MAKKITRRTFVGTSIHLAVVAPVIHLEPIEAAQPSARFPAVERRMLRAAIDVIIPAEGRMPAATAVGGLDYVERMAAADGKLRELLVGGMRALDAHSRATFGVAFVDARPAQQTAAIAHAEKTDSPPGFLSSAARRRLRGVLHATGDLEAARVYIPAREPPHRRSRTVR